MCYEVAKQVEIGTISKAAKLCWQNVNKRKEYPQYLLRLENCQKGQQKMRGKTHKVHIKTLSIKFLTYCLYERADLSN